MSRVIHHHHSPHHSRSNSPVLVQQQPAGHVLHQSVQHVTSQPVVASQRLVHNHSPVVSHVRHHSPTIVRHHSPAHVVNKTVVASTTVPVQQVVHQPIVHHQPQQTEFVREIVKKSSNKSAAHEQFLHESRKLQQLLAQEQCEPVRHAVVQDFNPTRRINFSTVQTPVQKQQEVVYVKDKKKKKKEKKERIVQAPQMVPVKKEIKIASINTKKLEDEILHLQEIMREKKKKKDENIEIFIDQNDDSEALKRLVKRNQKLEVEISGLKVRMEEYLSKYNSLKRSWEDKDEELQKTKTHLEKAKSHITELLLDLERHKVRCHYLEEDIERHHHKKKEVKVEVSKPQQPQVIHQPVHQPPQVIEKVIEKPIEIEKIVEKVIDRPIEIEKIVEKVIEVPVEVPFEVVKEVPVHITDTCQIDELRSQVSCLQRDLMDRTRECESLRVSTTVHNNDHLQHENATLREKVDLLYHQINDITNENTRKNRDLENYIKQLESQLSQHNIRYSAPNPAPVFHHHPPPPPIHFNGPPVPHHHHHHPVLSSMHHSPSHSRHVPSSIH